MSKTIPRNNHDKTPDQETTQGLGDQSRDPNAETRPPRVRMQGTLNLDYPEHLLDRQNFQYRWFNDDPSKPGRINAAKAAYWEPVLQDGAPVKRPSGSSTLFLMQLPMQYWLEDKALKREKIQATMATETTLAANEYAPDAQGNREGGTSARVSQTTNSNPFA